MLMEEEEEEEEEEEGRVAYALYAPCQGTHSEKCSL